MQSMGEGNDVADEGNNTCEVGNRKSRLYNDALRKSLRNARGKFEEKQTEGNSPRPAK
jgi:hypothetical protein